MSDCVSTCVCVCVCVGMSPCPSCARSSGVLMEPYSGKSFSIPVLKQQLKHQADTTLLGHTEVTITHRALPRSCGTHTHTHTRCHFPRALYTFLALHFGGKIIFSRTFSSHCWQCGAMDCNLSEITQQLKE